MSNFEGITVVPDPGRTLEGLRDTGYFFETAIADLVDNSIAANATIVDIRLQFDLTGKIVMSMADNGIGMDRNGLISAMQYGSPKRPNPASLGKYGLGLKTASTAFCRRISLISRMRGDSPVSMATWDLDYVSDVGEWILQISENPNMEALEHLDTIAKGHSGTVVLWENVDRLLKKQYKDPDGKHAGNALKKHCDNLMKHLAAVYQRFLDESDDRAAYVEIYLNGEQVHAWDPFQVHNSELVANECVPVETMEYGNTSFDVKAYILLRREDDPEAAQQALLSSDKQGIYVYRENRLIQDATWLGMYQKEPHFTLLRVDLSFDHKLDEALHLNIKKSQIILDDEILNYLRDDFLSPPRREANRRYRDGKRKLVKGRSSGAHTSSNNSIGVKEPAVGGAEVEVVNEAEGKVNVKTEFGTFPKRLRICPPKQPNEVFVQAVDGLEDGVLFEPVLSENKRAVQINTNHPYYHKMYIPNWNRSVTIQGIDSLLWALCVAELNATTDGTDDFFKRLRFDLSRSLRILVEDMPDPNIGDESDED